MAAENATVLDTAIAALPQIDPGLLTVLAIGGTALCCSCLMWLGERRARAEAQANAKAFRAEALQILAQANPPRAQPGEPQAAEVHASLGHAKL